MKKISIMIMAGCLFSGSLYCVYAGEVCGSGGMSTGDAETEVKSGKSEMAYGDKEDEPAAEVKAGKHRMAYRGFIGGMMLHTGLVSSRDVAVTSLSGQVQSVPVCGAPFGIGGAIRFMFGKHLRIGAEGYVSTLTYGQYRSHAETDWGGLLADCAWKVGKCRLFVGGTVGGGSQTNTTILSPVADDYVAEENISYRKYGFLAVAPFVGVEYAASRKINIVLKADYLLNATNPQDDFVTGPRLYLGFMFGHAD